MSKRQSAKYKLDRRMGENIWGRPKSPVNRREYGPGQHGQRRKGKMSDFGIQLRAKQKLKGYYGDITEKQFKKNYFEASRMKGDTGQNLIGLLERRLDAVVYRSKFTPTIFSARQLVSHGHVYVNGVKCNVASRLVKPGDEVTLGKKAQEMALVAEAQSLPERDLPEYLSVDGTVDLRPRAHARRSSLSGEDGTEPGRRILFALIAFDTEFKGAVRKRAALFVAPVISAERRRSGSTYRCVRRCRPDCAQDRDTRSVRRFARIFHRALHPPRVGRYRHSWSSVPWNIKTGT